MVPVIGRIVADHLDALDAAGGPADLVASFCLPIPALVVGELLGVAQVDAAPFEQASRTAVDCTASPADISDAMGTIANLLKAQVARKHAEPGDDLLSRLLADGLSPDEVATMGFLMLVAGHETTANMAGLAASALLTHPRQRAVFEAALADGDPVSDAGDGPIALAVEELLRYLTVNQFGAMRVARPGASLLVGDRDALEDAPLAPGDPVVVALAAANRDPARFENPDSLDLTRADAAAHLSFGHGAHLCSGATLARLELRLMLAGLFRRFPGVRLAGTPIRVRETASVFGVERLDVTW